MNFFDNKKMKDTIFYLIHNNAINRIEIREKIKFLIESLDFDLVEIFHQESLSNIKSTIKNKFLIIKIQFLRLIHINYKIKNGNFIKLSESYLQFFFKIFKLLIKIILQKKQEDLSYFKHLKIEQLVTKKHIKAWEEFLKTENYLMVVFEDDALVKHNSAKRLKDLLKSLENLDFEYLFIDLAGGYNYKEVVPKDNILKNNKNDIYIEGLFTNTACSYLMNRCLVEKLYKEFAASDLYVNFPIDNLMNKLNTKLKNPKQTLSLHFHNPIFTHGSFEGKVKSWQCN